MITKQSAMKKISFVLLCIIAFSFSKAQDSTHKNLPFKFTAEAAPEWTRLFERTSGWFGADGIFSIPLSGIDKNNNARNDSTLLLFSDTYIGEVKDGKPVHEWPRCTVVGLMDWPIRLLARGIVRTVGAWFFVWAFSLYSTLKCHNSQTRFAN